MIRVCTDMNLTNIKRVEYARCKGWNFRVYRGDETHSKLFSDGVYGGSKQALEAAIAYQKEYSEKHLIEKLFYHSKNVKSKTGAIGITLSCKWENDKLIQVAWMANTMKDGKQRHAYFSIVKWGYFGAYQLARNERIAFTKKQTVPWDAPSPPDWLIPFLDDKHIKYAC